VIVQPVEAIRAEFPALARSHHGELVAYFDGPGGTQVPRAVVEAMNDYLYHHNANTHWAYPTSAETDAAIDAARQVLADFLLATPAEIVFGLNMTSLTYHLGRGLGRGWDAGDEIIVTELDHHANIAPWQALARERGIGLRPIPLRTADGTLDLDVLSRVLGPRTRLVAVGMASNALGTVSDVSAICAKARHAGVLSFVDAVHAAPHLLIDVRAIGCDFLACSAYKFYGPHVGILYGRRALLESLDIPRLEPAPNTAPERLEPGTQNHEGIVGAAAAVDFLAGLGRGGSRRARLAATYGELHRRGAALFRQLWDGLGEIPKVQRFGPPPEAPRTPTLGFVVKGRASTTVAERLAGAGIYVSHGDFYAATVIERFELGPEGLVRAGMSCYSTADEVDRLIDQVAVIAKTR
jgi:cysteine desulfurase family protein (TIGR01976 family)